MAKFTKLNIGDIVASSGGRVWKKLSVESADDISGYITFSSPSSFTLSVIDNKKYWDGTLEYSTDASIWNTWNGTTALSADNGKLLLRGIGNTYITGTSAHERAGAWILNGENISISGNIETLLDYSTVENGVHPTMSDSAYKALFCSKDTPNTNITDIGELILPATTLTENCYKLMFYNCRSFKRAPKLPATTLAKGCYSSMFEICKGLEQAPKLPATTLAESCYSFMFSSCTLTSAPSLPATTLAKDCYNSMFNYCINLTTIPALPATTLAERCYMNMFSGSENVRIYSENSGDLTPYRIPTSGEGTTISNNSMSNMFARTGGTFTGTPSINTTYYTSNTVV